MGTRNHVENPPLFWEKTTKNQYSVFVQINGSNNFDTVCVKKRPWGAIEFSKQPILQKFSLYYIKIPF